MCTAHVFNGHKQEVKEVKGTNDCRGYLLHTWLCSFCHDIVNNFIIELFSLSAVKCLVFPGEAKIFSLIKTVIFAYVFDDACKGFHVY